MKKIFLKDMTVEELLEYLGDIAEHGDGDGQQWVKTTVELLRRFEALEKELADTKLYFESFVGHHEATMEVMEDLQCCGNCKSYHTRSDCMMKHEYRPNQYCDMWQSDGLSWEERKT